jgi:hypothetical protein
MKAEKDTTFSMNDISSQFVKNIAKLTGSQKSATDFLSQVAVYNQDYINDRKTADEWRDAVGKLAEKAVPEDTRARIQLNKMVYWLSPSFSMGSSAISHDVVPLKTDKVSKLKEELETGPLMDAMKKKYPVAGAGYVSLEIMGLKSTIKLLEALQNANNELKAGKITSKQWDDKMWAELSFLPKNPPNLGITYTIAKWIGDVGMTANGVKRSELEDVFDMLKTYKPKV